MDHKKALEKLGAFHDNALHAKDAMEISQHIAECELCKMELEAIKKDENALLSLKHDADMDPYFETRVMQAYRDREKVKFVPVKFLPVPVALAVFVLVLTAVMITSPFVYTADAENTKGEIGAIVLGAIIPDTPSKLFSPANIMALCNSCNHVLCGCCQNTGEMNCPAKRCMHGK